MNRDQLIHFEQSAERTRRVITQPFEIRDADEGSALLKYTGHAYVIDHEYPVYGGSFPGWMETMAPGASKRTLQKKADVSFLINHSGMTLARTKSGTMTLAEDDEGLAVDADLDRRQGPVNDLFIASERGDVDEMSFAFRVVKDLWFDDEGNKASLSDGTHRRIVEINLDKGDVSAVNYGANDATSGGFRDVDVALAEVRSGRPLNAEQRALIRELAAMLDEEIEPPAEDDAVLEMLALKMRSHWDRRVA